MTIVRRTGMAIATAIGVVLLAAGMATPASAQENDRAVASGAPPASAGCVSTTGVTACFAAGGDLIYVKDTVADGDGVQGHWQNYTGGTEPYRTGVCLNGLGYGHWGVCNKDFIEGSEIELRAEKWDHLSIWGDYTA